MALFETIDTSKVVMAAHVKDFLPLYNLLYNLIAYVQYESGNLSTLAQALISIISYHPLGLVVL
jgi:hypothetical protein